MVRLGPLSDEQRDALEQVRRRAVGRVSQRAHMVLLSARGYAVEQIAEIFGVGEDVCGVAAPLRAAGAARAGRPSWAGAGPRSTAWPAYRGRAGEQPAGQQRAGAGRLDGRAAGGVPGGALSVGPVARECPALPAPGRLALGAATLAPATHARRGQRKVDPAAPLKLALLAQAVASAPPSCISISPTSNCCR